MKSMTFPVALPEDFLRELREAARRTNLSMADVLRQSTKLGLPRLMEQMGVLPVTNVNPLPEKVARKLYRQTDDDVEAVELFMAAQSKSIQE
jgi:hypothetical protein